MVRTYSQQILYLLIILLALVVRLPLLSGSFWLDEAAQALESTRPLHQQFEIVYDFQPPLYHLLVHGFAYVSHDEAWLRLASLLPGLLTIVFAMRLATMLSQSSRVSLIVGLLLATSQYHVYYSQELRPYSLGAFFGVLSTYALLRWLRSSKRLSVLYMLSSLGGLMSVYTYVPLLIGQCVYVMLYHRAKLRSLMWQVLSMALLLSWWLPTVWLQWQRSMDVAFRWEGWSTAVSLPTLKALPLTFAKYLLGTPSIGWDFHTIVLVILIGIPICLVLFSQQQRISRERYLLMPLAAVLLAFMLNPWLPTLEPKRFMYVLPMLLILLASLIVRMQRSYVFVGLLVLGNLYALFSYWTVADYQREPWRTSIRQIETDAPDTAAVVFVFDTPFAPWNWYSTRSLTTYSLLPEYVLQNPDLDAHMGLHARVYVYDYLTDITDPERTVVDYVERMGFIEEDFWQYPGIGKVRSMQRIQ